MMTRVAMVTGILVGMAQIGQAGDPHGCGSTAGHSMNEAATPDIVDTAVQAGSFKTLVAAVKAAGLVDTLKQADGITVFAPTDEAFAKLPAGTVENLLKPENKEQLVNILTYHVVSGVVPFKAAVSVDEATALNNETIAVSVKQGALFLNDSRVVQNDIKASNGIIHVIDSVLLPPALPEDSRSAAVQLIELAISKGVPLFNHGHHGACADIYEVAAMALVNMTEDGLDSDTRADLKKQLSSKPSSESDSARAWRMRHALDRAMKAAH